MEINIPVSGVPQFNATPAIKTATTDSTPVQVSEPAPQEQVQFPAVAGATDPTASTQESPQELQSQATLQAALSFKNVYAVSDKEFSIFKDATGTYITRYVSLRDGTVTYEPQPQYVKPHQTASNGAQLSIDA